MDSPYDAPLLGMLQHEGHISKFLDAICSFLYRRTDFFVHLTPDGKMGFPPGVAKKMYLAAFKYYDELAAEGRTYRQHEDKHEKSATVEEVPPAVRTEEVTQTTTDLNGEPLKQVTEPEITIKEEAPKHSDPPQTSTNSTPGTSTTDSSNLSTNDMTRSPAQSANSVAPASNDTTNVTPVDQSTSDKEKVSDTPGNEKPSTAADNKPANIDDDPELTRMQKIFQANPESYNGAIRDKYRWSQSITDVDIRITVPPHIKKGKDVKVDIASKHLKVSYKDTDGQTVVIVDDDLPWQIEKEESMWSLVPGDHVHVNLEKHLERWWDSVLVSEAKISTRKIDPCRPMTDLDDAAQAKIDELMYNERQKQLGLPQSHESKAHEMLKKAWDVEGSPFKGQPFDPSAINITSSQDS